MWTIFALVVRSCTLTLLFLNCGSVLSFGDIVVHWFHRNSTYAIMLKIPWNPAHTTTYQGSAELLF